MSAACALARARLGVGDLDADELDRRAVASTTSPLLFLDLLLDLLLLGLLEEYAE